MIYNVIIFVFSSLVLINKWNAPHYIKEFFKIKPTTPIKPLECLQCFGFWISLIFTLDIYTAMSVFIVLFYLDKQ